MSAPVVILGIESSCDDTSASIIKDGVCLSNVTAGQKVHEDYGGVVPELASRAHQQNIVPVVVQALKEANVSAQEITAVGYTRGPGLLGSLLVGSSFAKGFSKSLSVPLIEVNHMQAHILAHFIREKNGDANPPEFPFLCLTVSGGHTQIVRVNSFFDMTLLGATLDDAAGEAFDKIAKIMGLPYPGGPLIDKLAQEGDPLAFSFPISSQKGLDYSFSGLKTSVLYFLQKQVKESPDFVETHLRDLCASIQHTIVSTLLIKVKRALKETGIKHLAVAGGVSANSGLRAAMRDLGTKQGVQVYLPALGYSTDNGAMIAISAYYKYLEHQVAQTGGAPLARLSVEDSL